jgi:hypothetical protein
MTTTNKPNVAFWIIAVIALVHNGMGVKAYLDQAMISDEALDLLPAAEQAMYNDIPAWATSAFAFAVFAGLLGSIALLMRKKLAKMLFLISFLGIVVHMSYIFFVSNAMEVYGNEGMVLPIIVIVGGIFLLWYSKYSIGKGWLK